MRFTALTLAVLLLVTALPLMAGGSRSGRGYLTRIHTDGVTMSGTGRANSPLAGVAGATGPTTAAVNGIVNSAVSTVATAVTSLTTRVSTLETNASTMAAGLSTAQADATSTGAAIQTLQTTATDHESRLATVETTVSSHTSQIGVLQTTGTDHASRIGTLETTATDHENRISTNASNINTHAQSLTTLETTPVTVAQNAADATSTGAAITDLQARAPSSAEKSWMGTQPMSAEHVTTDTLVSLLPAASTTGAGITRVAQWNEEAGGVPLQSNDPRLRSMRAVYVSTATTTVSNTSDPTPFMPEFSLGTTVFTTSQQQAGDTVRLEAWGIMDSAASAGTGNIGIVANGTPMAAGGATLGNNLSGRGWHLLARMTIRDASTAYFDGVWDCGPTMFRLVPQTITYDSTISQEIGLVWTFGTADISNTITCTQITVEALR